MAKTGTVEEAEKMTAVWWRRGDGSHGGDVTVAAKV